MASGWEPIDISEEELADGDAYHNALYHNGDTRNPAEWHKISVEKLIDLAIPHIKDGALIVDYGCGTGGSAIELLKTLDMRGLEVELVLIDPLVSWFSKAREILGERDNVHFELSVQTDNSGKRSFRRLEEMLSGRKANLIISSSTLHLIPEKTIGDLMIQFANSLDEDGVLIWDSGDLESDLRPENSALLHDPYRHVREILREDNMRSSRLSEMSVADREKHERRLDRIFPSPTHLQVILDALGDVGFSIEVSDLVVDFSNGDAERFILVPRLAEIAAPLLKGKERSIAIKSALRDSLELIANNGRGTGTHYRSHWVYGFHKLT